MKHLDYSQFFNQREIKGKPSHLTVLTIGPTNSVIQIECHLCSECLFYDSESGPEWQGKISAFIEKHTHEK